MQLNFKYQTLLSSGFLAGSLIALSACGGSGSPSAGSDAISDSSSNDARSKAVQGPLDPLQSAVVSDVIGNALGSALPAPLGPTVSCLSDAVNSLIDGPDALLAALTNLNGADPAAALQGASDQFTGSLERFAAELQSGLSVLAGSSDTCSTVASGGSFGSFGASNPLAGTPLEDVGSALTDLLGGLGSLDSGSDTDPDLRAVSDTVQPLLMQLASALNQVPQEARNAPVVGGIFTTIQSAVLDLHAVMPALGNYDAPATQFGIEGLVNNLLDNVLTGVLPVAEIDAQTGQDFSGQIRAGIDQATALLGSGLGQLITPLFDDALNGALEPVLDPVEGLLVQLLNPVGLTGANPFTGLLGSVAGNGSANQLDVLLGLLSFGSAGNPLDQLTGAIGGNTNGSPLTQLTDLLGDGGLPLDSVLGQLSAGAGGTASLNGLLDGLLGGLLGD